MEQDNDAVARNRPIRYVFGAQAQAQPAQLPVVQIITVGQRILAFNEWKKDPEIAKRLNTDEPGTVQAYIHLTMFIKETEEEAKSPVRIGHAALFAKQVCPSYAFWDEYYQAFSRPNVVNAIPMKSRLN